MGFRPKWLENGNRINDNQGIKESMIYFIMIKFNIEDSDYPPEYRVEKFTNSLDEANKFLSALTLLEDSKHITWHIVKHDFNEPLILTKEVA